MRLKIREVKRNNIEHANTDQKKASLYVPPINMDTIKNRSLECLMARHLKEGAK